MLKHRRTIKVIYWAAIITHKRCKTSSQWRRSRRKWRKKLAWGRSVMTVVTTAVKLNRPFISSPWFRNAMSAQRACQHRRRPSPKRHRRQPPSSNRITSRYHREPFWVRRVASPFRACRWRLSRPWSRRASQERSMSLIRQQRTATISARSMWKRTARLLITSRSIFTLRIRQICPHPSPPSPSNR